MARRPARVVRRAAAVVAAATVLLVASGCGAISELISLQERLENAGYRVTSTFHDDGIGVAGDSVVEVEATTGRGEPPPEGNEEIAGIVWRTYPRSFDAVRVGLDGVTQRFERSQLQERFGARDPALDERTFNDDITSGLRSAAWIGVSALAGVAVLAVVIVLLVRRRRGDGPPPAGPAGGAGNVRYPHLPPPPLGGGGLAAPPGAGQAGWPPPPPAGPPPGWTPPVV